MQAGTDNGTGHGFYQRVPIPRRAPLNWPNGAAAAFAVLVSAEYYEMQPPENAFIPPNVPGGFGRGPYPDFRVYTARAYGNRVGIFRLYEALERHRLPATVAVDMLTARLCPAVIREAKRRGFEIAGHGQAVTRVISANMTEAEERAYIKRSLDAVEAASGTRPKGWHGAEYGESSRTPALLAELGVQYVMDWPNDEQPYTMTTSAGPIVSVPVAIDCDDVFSHFHRRITMRRWVQCVVEALDRLIADGRNSGRLLVLNVHPWLMGHPYRASYFEELLQAVTARKDVWATTTGAIAAWWKDQGVAVALGRQPMSRD
jgi:peptidoglycan/xylan/chitin deacetylase (PgdA/CDA1 family)